MTRSARAPEGALLSLARLYAGRPPSTTAAAPRAKPFAPSSLGCSGRLKRGARGRRLPWVRAMHGFHALDDFLRPPRLSDLSGDGPSGGRSSAPGRGGRE